ncbi:hypothetical protein NSK_001683 [Nannochloropsis salina CCMP1776]|uniref:tRNA-binding domain-containing protein n=1 Tax=Nannochloropsis salina CCMP1776 TaxID=1027361 RepID=A0A4D9D6M0_9STRA|nr:hypothetical protein NSK_001683 [Nannochloropsis salina CCMP1776]|eukprot:TFJ87351.1 hypothetical protein NSK_001683 [Nannochloropsis salina CCMP1776]
MKRIVLMYALVMLLRSASAFTTRILVSGTQKSRRTARKALSVTRHGSGLTRKRRHQGIDRVPFLNQGLAQAAHTRLFSTTEDTTAPSTTSASTEEELPQLLLHWSDSAKTSLRVSWTDTPSPTTPSHAYRIDYSRDGVPNRLTLGGTSREAMIRGLHAGSQYDVAVVRVEREGLAEKVVGRARLETGKVVEAPKGELTELSRLEIRTGKILEISLHPEADGLYVEKIDLGEADGPRTIVSGLVKYQTEEELLGREVVVLANLKPRALKGITSHGMLLCASNEDHTVVKPLSPPPGVALGELITFEGHMAAPEPPGNRAGKAFDRVAEELGAGEDMIATYKGIPFMTSKGPVTTGMAGSIS